MDFVESQKWLQQLPEPSVWNLDRMRHLAADAQVAVEKIKAVQVAGTNGKGSTCAFLAAILQSAGLKTGLYTSPHLLDVRERIQINGRMVSKEDFEALATWARPFVEKHGASLFESYTLMAFKHFLDQRVDWAVVEVGLGGAKDATSILQPNIALIPHVALDHADLLGNTVGQIATEKAGIIPQRGTCLTTAEGKAYDAIGDNSQEKNARLQKVLPFNVVSENPLRVDLDGQTIPLGLQGRFQAENAALAVAAARELKRQNVAIAENAIRAGLQNAAWPGRMQKIGNVIVDGAHNPDGIRASVEALQAAYPGQNWHVVFGVLSDKDYSAMVDELCRLPIGSVTLVTPENPRALSAERLVPLFREKKIKANVAPSVQTALGHLGNLPTVVCGSLYVAAAALRALDENTPPV